MAPSRRAVKLRTQNTEAILQPIHASSLTHPQETECSAKHGWKTKLRRIYAECLTEVAKQGASSKYGWELSFWGDDSRLVYASGSWFPRSPTKLTADKDVLHFWVTLEISNAIWTWIMHTSSASRWTEHGFCAGGASKTRSTLYGVFYRRSMESGWNGL